MLLETTRDFKVGNVYEGVDWEAWKKNTRKYAKKICQIYLQQKMKCFNIQGALLHKTVLLQK